MVDQLVTPEAQAKGAYAVVDVVVTQGEFGRATKGTMRAVVNRGGTPLARWRRDGHLSASQEAAIAHCLRLWDCLGTSRGLVANLDRTVFGTPGDGHAREVEARSDLQRMKAHVGHRYWDVFENVVRFDEPAGSAGSRLSAPESNKEYAARLTVQFVADIITLRERLAC